MVMVEPLSGPGLSAAMVPRCPFTTDFTMKRSGKAIGAVHRVVSADGKTLTVHNTGTHPDGKPYDDTLVFDKQ